MAERYPAYFDGIVAGAPAMRTSFSGIHAQYKGNGNPEDGANFECRR